MFNELHPREQAALMLSTPLSREDCPLDRNLYYNVVQTLEHNGMDTSYLLERDNRQAIHALDADQLPYETVEKRVKAGFAMALVMDNWSRRAIHVVSHMNPAYPRELYSLGDDAPPFLWIAGSSPSLRTARAKGTAVRPVHNILNFALNRKVRTALLADELTLVAVASPYQGRTNRMDIMASMRIRDQYA